jgi:hypothetical protein
MSLNKNPLTATQKQSMIALGVVTAIGMSFIGGMALTRALDDQYRTPHMLEDVYRKAQETLIDRSDKVFRDDQLAQLSFISGLRQAGVAEAYNVEIRKLRSNAFEKSQETHDVAAIQAIDTRMADGLLLEAIAKLGDSDLYAVLKENERLFLSSARKWMLDDTDATENNLRYSNLYEAHTTLSEQERDELTACYNKLFEKLGKVKDDVLKYDLGSGTCIATVEPKKVDLFSPRRFLQYQ